ncbi:MAG: hypothetical protein OQL09_08770, partial [Gammaproteobacteria bacterium]|nr:hypothetical protein [Gammaproteobacteria bacterium]
MNTAICQKKTGTKKSSDKFIGDNEEQVQEEEMLLDDVTEDEELDCVALDDEDAPEEIAEKVEVKSEPKKFKARATTSRKELDAT